MYIFIAQEKLVGGRPCDNASNALYGRESTIYYLT